MKVYILGSDLSDDQEYGDAAARLRGAGHQVEVMPPVVHLDRELAALLLCDAVCLLDGWWSSLRATQLQTVAGWLRMKHLDAKGNKLATNSLRS